jgi:hypothetical protein
LNGWFSSLSGANSTEEAGVHEHDASDYGFCGEELPLRLFFVCRWAAALKSGAMRAMASLSCGAATLAIAPSIPPNTFPRQSRRRPTPRFCAAGANGTNMHQCWSDRREATAIDSSSSKVRRRED